VINRIPGFVYGGVRVYANDLATQTAPRKQHKKTASMSEFYHQRIQKKWNKRFGMKQAPGCFQLADGTLVMHPDLLELLKQEVDRA
jgi:predicted protein tyrosine phosphatase